MNDMQIFKNDEFGAIRTVVVDGEAWFVGKDVVNILGYQNGSRDINRHVDEEDRQNYQNGTFESNRGLTIINESGLYSLILSSHLESAKRFKRWVTAVVLPSIRRDGGYLDGQDSMSEEELMAKAILFADNKIKHLQDDVTRMRPKEIFADAVATSDRSILIGELAKILKQNGVDTGQQRLFERLRSEGFLVSGNRSDRNMPTQRSMQMGLFEIKETAVTHADGHVTVNKTPKVTGKGQQYFINRFLTREERNEPQFRTAQQG